MMCDYIRVICRRDTIVFPALKQNLGGHKIKTDREWEMFVSFWPITQFAEWRNLGIGLNYALVRVEK
jgi:hypothetical protein